MFRRRKDKIAIPTQRMILRLPTMSDHEEWVHLRRDSATFLSAWEPHRETEQVSRRAFRNRVYWAEQSCASGRGLPLFLIRREDDVLLGAITLDNIRRGPSQACTVGYWVGQVHARQGYMSEAVSALVNHAFHDMNLSRVEAATLPENTPSRGLLERNGFKYEGVAQSYLQIAGRWRTHVLYANLREDRRGRAGVESVTG